MENVFENKDLKKVYEDLHQFAQHYKNEGLKNAICLIDNELSKLQKENKNVQIKADFFRAEIAAYENIIKILKENTLF